MIKKEFKMKITCVIVTFNRLDKLRKSLLSYSMQTLLPDTIIVVDNGSSQNTKDFLVSWTQKEENLTKVVLTLDKNYGGSGGFYFGIKKALEIGFDWIWLSDDDAYPNNDCFFQMNQFVSSHDFKVVCSSVSTNRGIDYSHRRLFYRKRMSSQFVSVDDEMYKKDYFFLNVFSFVGLAIQKEVIQKCGLPFKDYFIWGDDGEYSLRVNDFYDIVCNPKMLVFHDSNNEQGSLSWKSYYGFRNRFDLLKRHSSKRAFFWYCQKYRINMVLAFFSNKSLYQILKTARKDYKQKRFGISIRYFPGAKI